MLYYIIKYIVICKLFNVNISVGDYENFSSKSILDITENSSRYYRNTMIISRILENDGVVIHCLSPCFFFGTFLCSYTGCSGIGVIGIADPLFILDR